MELLLPNHCLLLAQITAIWYHISASYSLKSPPYWAFCSFNPHVDDCPFSIKKLMSIRPVLAPPAIVNHCHIGASCSLEPLPYPYLLVSQIATKSLVYWCPKLLLLPLHYPWVRVVHQAAGRWNRIWLAAQVWIEKPELGHGLEPDQQCCFGYRFLGSPLRFKMLGLHK